MKQKYKEEQLCLRTATSEYQPDLGRLVVSVRTH